MTCREGTAFVNAGREADFEAHRASCAACAVLGRQMDAVASLTRALAIAPAPPTLRAALLDVPRRTVSCEGADELLARALEAEIAPPDEARWKFHLSRCAPCSETAQTLHAARGLVMPVAPPWFATRLSTARPAPRKKAGGLWGLLWSPRGAIGLAYTAAIVVMLTGFNPAELARKAGMARLEDATGAAVATARAGAVEKIGAVEEKAFRSVEAWKGRLLGYGRATLENALALVMRTDSKRPPDRPKSGEGKGDQRNWDGVRVAGKRGPHGPPITAWRT